MKRREFLIASAALATAMRQAMAQQAAKMKRIAMAHVTMKPDDMRIGGDPTYTVLFEEMKRLGYVEGVNLIVDRYSAEGRYDRFPEIAHEVVASHPDVIFSLSNLLVLAFKSETRTIPIVAWTTDPIAGGIVSNLAHPGGNITGLSIDAGAEIQTKRVQLLADAVGKLTHARSLTQAQFQQSPFFRMAMEAAERRNIILRLEPLPSPINEDAYRRVFEAMQRDHVEAVFIGSDSENYTYRVLLGELAKQYRLPAICWFSDSVRAGALMSYSLDLKAGARRLAAQIVEILNGGKPADMPYFQETHFELVINLKAAKELGLEIPATLLASADEVIE